MPHHERVDASLIQITVRADDGFEIRRPRIPVSTQLNRQHESTRVLERILRIRESVQVQSARNGFDCREGPAELRLFGRYRALGAQEQERHLHAFGLFGVVLQDLAERLVEELFDFRQPHAGRDVPDVRVICVREQVVCEAARDAGDGQGCPRGQRFGVVFFRALQVQWVGALFDRFDEFEPGVETCFQVAFGVGLQHPGP